MTTRVSNDRPPGRLVDHESMVDFGILVGRVSKCGRLPVLYLMSPVLSEMFPVLSKMFPRCLPILKLFSLVFDYKNHAIHLIGMLRQGHAVGADPCCTEK